MGDVNYIAEAYELLVPSATSASEAFAIGWQNGNEAARSDFECRAWQIIDADGLAPVPSDLWEALERLARAARNRDMWKAQCERQADVLRSIAEGNLGDMPWQANYARVKQVAAQVIEAHRAATTGAVHESTVRKDAPNAA